MKHSTSSRSGPARSDDELFGYLAILIALTTGCVWTTTWLANGFAAPAGGIGGFARGLWQLVQTPSEPSSAFGGTFPDVLWWSILLALFAAVVTATVYGHLRLHGKVGPERRKRLGVDTEARFADEDDLRPLHVSGPTEGRFIFGEAHGRLLASEDRRHPGRDKKRQGDKACIAVFGPARSGKTANAICGVLDWTGPAVLSSVRGDLMNATIGRRSQLGDVRVWDPANCTNHHTSHWSPLRGASTVTGAMRAAEALAAAMSRGGVKDADFFATYSKNLMWPLLWTAANSPGRSMSDVVRWAMNMDRPVADDEGEIGHLLRNLLGQSDPTIVDGATRATESLSSVWGASDQTASSCYATISSQIGVFHDPAVATACDGPANIDLEWLLSGNNTLYICAPSGEQKRLATPIMGLVRDLIDQAYAHEIRHGAIENTVLMLLDEMGQTPVTWLPEVSATAAGTGLLLTTIWQSKAQVSAEYQAHGDVILANHLTKLFFSGASETPTMNYVTELVGKEEVTTRSQSLGPSALDPVNGAQRQTRESDLVPGHVLRQAPTGEAVLIHGNLPPAHIKGRYWGTDSRLSRLANLPVADPDELAEPCEPSDDHAASALSPAVTPKFRPGFYGSTVASVFPEPMPEEGPPPCTSQ